MRTNIGANRWERVATPDDLQCLHDLALGHQVNILSTVHAQRTRSLAMWHKATVTRGHLYSVNCVVLYVARHRRIHHTTLTIILSTYIVTDSHHKAIESSPVGEGFSY